MKRALISLYVLLTTPIPMQWTLLFKAAALVLVYAIARPFEQSIGLDALTLSILAGLLVVLSRNLANALRQIEHDDISATTLVILVTLLLGTASVVLFAPSPRWLQHTISAGWAIYGLFYALMLTCNRKKLSDFEWIGQDLQSGQDNAARWMILRCLGMATANEFAIARFTQVEWLMTYAALPIVFHALFYWSVLATHPYEDDA